MSAPPDVAETTTPDVGRLPTSPTDQEISEAIEAGFLDRRMSPAPQLALEETVIAWWSSVFDDGTTPLWERWPCEDDDCPALPDYDKAISSMSNELAAVQEEAHTLIAARLMGMARRIRDAFPDAPRPSTMPEVSAAD